MCKRRAPCDGAEAIDFDDIERLVEAWSHLPPDERARQALILSAKLVEFAAFESAPWLSSRNVGELINWAAQLDRRSHGLPSELPMMAAQQSETIH